jgi:hypothetical protein
MLLLPSFAGSIPVKVSLACAPQASFSSATKPRHFVHGFGFDTVLYAAGI